MGIVLGVDGGASKTHALVVDEFGRILGYGKAGPANHQIRGLAPALAEIKRAVRAAIECGELSGTAVEVGCFCLAGADLPKDYAMLQEAVEALQLTNKTIVKNDTMAALRAGLTRTWGIVVICGTGFNAAGRAPDGREIVLPGLGPISGDWGGGGALSQEMIRMVMRAWDGRGKPALLTKLVLETLGVPSVEILLSKLYHDEIGQRRLLDLVPLLFEAAEMGDEVSRKLIVQMGTEVGVTANALIRRLSLGKEDVEVILGGGVFKGKGSLLLDTVKRVVCKEAPKAHVSRLQREPVVGAVLLALESSGEAAGEVIQRSLESSLPAELVY
jgi:N-acetylglucosamine kinase-like BadF-type ATPase